MEFPLPPSAPARYRIIAEIGVGATARVFRTRDRLDGREVAMKIHRRPLHGAELVSFLREFRLLAEHPHRCLLDVYGCGVHDSLPYVVMELAEGGDATHLVGKLAPERFRQVICDLLDGLEHLHRRGLVHRDLKPGNLLVYETPEGPALRIADLGLSVPIDAVAAGLAGTPGYLAPEFLDGAPPSVVTDLFALGACLFELATGVPAFPQVDAVGAMRAARRRSVCGVRGGGVNLPDDVADLIERLLDPNPARRPHSAAAAREVLDADPGSSEARMVQPMLTGRAEVMRAVRRSLTLSARRRRQEWVLLDAASGMGLSRLLAEAAIVGQRLGTSVVRIAPGEGEDGQAALALALCAAEFDRRDALAGVAVRDAADWEVIAGLLAALESKDGVAAAEDEGDGASDAAAAAESAPSRGHTTGAGAEWAGDRAALVHAFGSVVRELSGARRTLLLIDAPGEAIPLVEQVLSALAEAVPKGRLAVVAGAPQRLRPPRVPDGFFSQRLAPLSEVEVGMLLAAHLGSERLRPEFVREVYRASGGVPARVFRGVKALIRSGQLVYDQCWSAELPDLRFRVPETEEGTATLPQDLAPAERRVAAALAILGNSRLSDLAALAECSRAGLIPAIERLERGGLVDRSGPGGLSGGETEVRFSTAALTTSIIETLAPREREHLHRRAAAVLREVAARQQQGVGAQALARAALHLGEVGEFDAAIQALSEAGRRWQRLQVPMEEAEALAMFVGRFRDQAPAELLEEVSLEWGEALERAGRAPEVEAALVPLLNSEDPLRRARAAGTLARVLVVMNRSVEAERVVAVGLLATERLEGTEAAALRVQLLHRRGLAQLARRELEACLASLAAAEEVIPEILDGRRERAALKHTRAQVDLNRGNLAAATQAYADALATFVELGDERRATACEVAIGAVHWQRGEYVHAVECFRNAAERSRRTHDLNAYLVALSNQAVAQAAGGEWNEAAETYRDVLAVASSVGDLPARMRALNNLGQLLRDQGDFRRSRVLLEEALELAHALEEWTGVAAVEGNLGELAMLDGDATDARERFGRAAALWVEHAAPGDSRGMVATGSGIEALRRIIGWELEYGDLAVAGALTAIALRAAARNGSRAEIAHVLALGGAVTRQRGLRERALSRYSRARRLMAKSNLIHAAHRVDVQRSQILQWMRRYGAARAVLEHAIAGFEKLGALADHSLANRLLLEIDNDAPAAGEQARSLTGEHLLRHLLDITLQINAIHELSPLLDLIAQKTIELTGGKRALLFLKNEKNKESELVAYAGPEVAAGTAIEYSKTFVEDVFRRGQVVIVTNAEEAQDFRRRSSIRELDLRFMIGLPVASMEGVIGVIYVDDERPVYDLGRDELFVLQSLANQAALAIRNARLFERATVDGLTRVAMRHYFLQRLAEDYERTMGMGLPFSLLMVDIDHFKRVNDELGHAQGDRVLAGVAAILKDLAQGPGMVGRLGGEEFAVTLPGMTALAAAQVAERLRAGIEAAALIKGRSLTCSFGVAGVEAADRRSVEMLLPSADDALYKAKHGGRNRVEMADITVQHTE
jgi:diguanylate cyclase (GGDEF)-like protein